MNSICNDNDNYMDRTAALLVKLYASYAMKEGQNDDYAMAVGIAVRMLSD
jgi:hypothetical protein